MRYQREVHYVSAEEYVDCPRRLQLSVDSLRKVQLRLTEPEYSTRSTSPDDVHPVRDSPLCQTSVTLGDDQRGIGYLHEGHEARL